MKITKKLYIIIITAVFVIIFSGSILLKSDSGLFCLPKSYVLLCMDDTLEEKWRGLISLYHSAFGVSVTAFKEEKEVLSLNGYNDKHKIILSSPRLFGNNYFGLAKDKTGQSNKSGVRNKGKTGEKKENDLSLTEIYEKYASVSKTDRKSFAVTGGKDSMYETDGYEVVLKRNIKDILPDYLKKYIADDAILEGIENCLKKLDSDVTMDVYVDRSGKIRGLNLSYSYGGQDAYAEITFNNAVHYWDDISATYILNGADKTTVTVKSKGNHTGEGNRFTDETNVIVLSGAMTKAQLNIVTDIDRNKQKDNINMKLKGDLYGIPVHADAAGDVGTCNKAAVRMDIDLELKYVDYLLKLNLDEADKNLKKVDSYDSFKSLYKKEISGINDYLQVILE